MPLWTLNTEIALTTVDRAKQHLNIPDADTDYDDILTRFINEASQRLEKMTGRRLKARDYSGSNPEHHDGRMQNRLLAREWPINSVTELWFDSSSEFTDTTNIVDSGKYSIDDEKIGIVLHKGCRFPRGTRNIRLVYNGGYSEIPTDLEGACLWMVEYFYAQRSNESIGTQTKSKNAENITYLKDVPEHVMDVINSYKRYEFPGATLAVDNI